MVHHRIPHTLDVPDARTLIDRAFAHYRERYPKYDPKLHWVDTHHGEIHVEIRGYKLSARIKLHHHNAIVEMDLPLLLRPFQSTAVRVIDREATRWLTPTPVAPA